MAALRRGSPSPMSSPAPSRCAHAPSPPSYVLVLGVPIAFILFVNIYVLCVVLLNYYLDLLCVANVFMAKDIGYFSG